MSGLRLILGVLSVASVAAAPLPTAAQWRADLKYLADVWWCRRSD